MIESGEHSVERVDSLFPAGLVLDALITDFDEVSDLAPGWTLEYVPLGRGPLRGRIFAVHTPMLQLGIVDFSKGYNVRGEVPTRSLTAAFPNPPAVPPIWRGQSLAEREAILCSGFEEIEGSFPSPQHDQLIVSVSQSLVDAAAIRLWGTPITSDRLTFHDEDAAARFRAMFHRVTEAARRHPDRLHLPETAAILESDVVDSLLRETSPAASTVAVRARHEAARCAYAHLMDHRSSPVTVGELCAASGMSERTLQRAFLEIYGLPPAALVKSVRLAGARRALQDPSETTSVTDVALHRGFFHLGRFAHDYRELFGESPSETLRRALDAGPDESTGSNDK
jgi:AraC family transcriptional regulator, ethanolamine operon transcriptional activator